MKKNLLFFIFFLFILSHIAQAQGVMIRGKVEDSHGPLPGVTILVKGTQSGIATDADGNYSITVPSSRSVLQFSSIGYEPHEVQVGNKTTINVVLIESSEMLEEFVAIGYQGVQKKFATGAITSVSTKELANLPSTSLTDLLAGKATGVMAMNLGGAPGAGGALVIRGNTVVSGSLGDANSFSNPLYVIDGVPTTLEEVAGYGKSNNDFLSSLNLEDIESIDILKDASAAAIYGSRGANGVIIIKTKGGSVGKMTVSVKAYSGVTVKPSLLTIPVGSAERQMKMDLIYGAWGYNPLKNALPIMLTDSLNPAFNNNINYQDMFFQQGLVQDYSAAIRGGSEELNYRFSAGFYNETGIIKGTGIDRYTTTLNISQKPWKNVRNQTITNFSYIDRKPGRSNQNSRGNFPVSISNMNSSLLHLSDDQYNYINGSLDNYYRTDRAINAQLTNILNVDLWKYVAFNSQLTASYNNTKKNLFEPSTIRTSGLSRARYDYDERLAFTGENYLSFSGDIAEHHNLNALLGTSYEYSRMEGLYAEATGGSSDIIKTINGFKKEDIFGFSDISENSMLSFWARAGYRFKERYQIDINYRRDASSRFGQNMRWANFPSMGIFWILNEEPFMKGTEDWLTFAKLKFSIGKNGKQFTDNYLRYNMYRTGYDGFSGMSRGSMNTSTYNGVSAVIPDFSKLADDNLSWETSVQSDFGIDLELFKNRVYVSANYYNKNTDRLLFDVAFPAYTGFSQVKSNIAGVRNNGYEVSVDAHLFPRQNDFTLQISTGISQNTNVITKLPNNNRDYISGSYGYTVGKPGPLFNGLIYEGPLKSMDDLAVNPFTGEKISLSKGGIWGSVAPGYPIFKDVSGDYLVSDNADQDVVLANYDPNPKLSGHLNITVGYKDWQLRGSSYFIFGRDVYDEVSQAILNRYDGSDWAQKAMLNLADFDVWTPENVNAYYPSILPQASGVSGRYAFRSGTTMWWEDGSFWRISDVTLSYNVPRKWLKNNLKMERVYLFATAYNLWQWQASDRLMDASMVDSRGYTIGDGYPQPRKYTFGINVEF